MPVQHEAHPHAVCRAVFGGLLPEGAERDALARRLGYSTGNDFGLLGAVGGDCASAITLRPDSAAQPTLRPLRRLDPLELDAELRALPQRALGADPAQGVRLSLASAQPKLPVVIDPDGVALPRDSATPSTHILKPEPARFPGLVANEAFCMRLARAASLQAVAVHVAGREHLDHAVVDVVKRLMPISL